VEVDSGSNMLPVPPPPEPIESAAESFAAGPPSRVRPSAFNDEETAQSEPLPSDWIAILESNVFHYRLLSETERSRLSNDARTMIEEKSWEGCGGLSVTDEMKVTIAAQACLMLLGREHDGFSRVISILVYPSGFQAIDDTWQNEGWGPAALAGQAVYHGPVILAWDIVLAEGRDPSAGRNLVIHEFAHQLDFVDGYADGTLDLGGKEAERWNQTLTAEYNRLRREIRQGHETFLGDYAATNKTEFFATASERFFTQPEKLRHYHSQLYELLAATYAIDPERWFSKMR
jgi:Mlc titration factor MtfA (ptsG expression regulator)